MSTNNHTIVGYGTQPGATVILANASQKISFKLGDSDDNEIGKFDTNGLSFKNNCGILLKNAHAFRYYNSAVYVGVSAEPLKLVGSSIESGSLTVNGDITSNNVTVNGHIDFYYNNKKSGRLGQTADNDLTIEGSHICLDRTKYLKCATSDVGTFQLLGVSSSNNIVLGEKGQPGHTNIYTKSDKRINFYVDSSDVGSFDANGLTVSGFKVPNIQRGSVNITPSAANTPTGKAITFPKEFAGSPTVVTNALSTVPGTYVTGTSATSVSKTGCTIYLTRANLDSTSVTWIAVYY